MNLPVFFVVFVFFFGGGWWRKDNNYPFSTSKPVLLGGVFFDRTELGEKQWNISSAGKVKSAGRILGSHVEASFHRSRTSYPATTPVHVDSGGTILKDLATDKSLFR